MYLACYLRQPRSENALRCLLLSQICESVVFTEQLACVAVFCAPGLQ